MEITIKGEPKEIAALVLAVQERQERRPITVKPTLNGKELGESFLHGAEG